MKRILVADDDPQLARLVRINLELSGFIVEEARDGDKAMKLLRRKAPGLLVLDPVMSRTDGWDVLRLVREDPELAELPVILLTAKAREDDVIRGWEMGADDYITKPFNPTCLSDKVKNLLNTTCEERAACRRCELARLTRAGHAKTSEGT